MAADFNKPITTDNHATTYTPTIKDNLVALAKALDPAVVTPSNIPTNAIGFSSGNKRWEKWNGSTWANNEPGGGYAINISGSSATCTGNAASATTANQLGGVAAANFSTTAQMTAAIVGKQTVWVPAGAMTPRITNGPSVGLVETTTNKIQLATLDFDQTTAEYAQFQIRMPKSWNEGTLTAMFDWSSAIAGTNAVKWNLRAVAISDDDALDAAMGTAVTVTDAQTAVGDLMKTAETSAMTIAGTPVVGDMVVFEVYRDAADGGDTLAGDARLHGVTLFYTTDALNDA